MGLFRSLFALSEGCLFYPNDRMKDVCVGNVNGKFEPQNVNYIKRHDRRQDQTFSKKYFIFTEKKSTKMNSSDTIER